MLFLECKCPCFTPIQNKWKNCLHHSVSVVLIEFFLFELVQEEISSRSLQSIGNLLVSPSSLHLFLGLPVSLLLLAMLCNTWFRVLLSSISCTCSNHINVKTFGAQFAFFSDDAHRKLFR